MGTTDNYCLKWNDFQSNVSASFREIRANEEFFDVTLSCDEGNNQIQAHKVILAACSPFFKRVLARNPHQNPLIYLKGVDYANLSAVLNFMYHGEVNVAQDELSAFLAVAEELAVKGLTDKNNGESSSSNNSPKAKTEKKPPVLNRPPPLKQGGKATSLQAATMMAQAKKRKMETSSPLVAAGPSTSAASSSFGNAAAAAKLELKPELNPVLAQEEEEEEEAFDESEMAEAEGQYGAFGQYDEGEFIGHDDSNSGDVSVGQIGGEGGKGPDGGVDAFIVRDPGGTYWCQACSHKSTRRQDLVRHVERKHHSQGYDCHYCREQFRARDQLLKHLRFAHARPL